MDILEVESYIEHILRCSYNIKEGMVQTPLYSYFHQGNEFTYVHLLSTEKNSHRFILNNSNVLDVDIINMEIEYMVNGKIINHSLDISEEWHFQLSTKDPLISYEHVQMVKNILNIIA